MTLRTAIAAKTATDAIIIPDGEVIDTLIATDIDTKIAAAIIRKKYALRYDVNGRMDSGKIKTIQSDDSLVDLDELIAAIELKGYRCICHERALTSGIIRIIIKVGWR